MSSAGRKKVTAGQIVLVIAFSIICLSVLVPVINLVARSFASSKGALEMRGFSLWPSDPTLLNYRVVFSNKLILPAAWNNVLITVVGTAVNVLVTSMAAYAVTRPSLPGKSFFMGFFIVMMLFNPGLIPEYLVVKQLKLMDSMWSIILSGAVNVYYLFILRRFFEAVPESLIAAEEVIQISSGIVSAAVAVTVRIERSEVFPIDRFANIDTSFTGHQCAVAGNSCRQHTVAHIDVQRDCFKKIVHCSNAHKISRLVIWQLFR